MKLDRRGMLSHLRLQRIDFLLYLLKRPQGFKGDVGPIGFKGIQGPKGDKVNLSV